MNDKKRDWDGVNKIIKQPEKGNLSAFDKSISLSGDTPEGIITKFKAKQIERKAGLRMLRVIYQNKLEVVEVQIRQAAHLKKQEAIVEAGRFLNELDRRQVEYFAEFGLKNFDLRSRTIVRLGDQTTDILKELADKDYPEAMKEKLIKGIYKLHEDFFEKLLKELDELDVSKE